MEDDKKDPLGLETAYKNKSFQGFIAIDPLGLETAYKKKSGGVNGSAESSTELDGESSSNTPRPSITSSVLNVLGKTFSARKYPLAPIVLNEEEQAAAQAQAETSPEYIQQQQVAAATAAYDANQGAGSSEAISNIANAKPVNEIGTDGRAVISSVNALGQAIQEDDQSAGDYIKHYYNKILTGVGKSASGFADLTAQAVMAVMPETAGPNGAADREAALKNVREQIEPAVRTGLKEQVGVEVSAEDAAAIDEGFVSGAIGGLAESIPAMASPLGSGIYLQSYDQAIATVNNSEVGRALDEDTKTIYAGSIGTVIGLLEKIGLTRILKNVKQFQGISNGIVLNTIRDLSEKTGGKITADLLDVALQREVNIFANRFKNVGYKALESFGVEFATGSAQEIAQITSEHLLNKATGESVFDTEDPNSWQGWSNNFQRTLKAGVQEGIGGMVMGGSLSVFSRPKTKDYIISKIAEAETEADVDILKGEVAQILAEEKSSADGEPIYKTIDNLYKIKTSIPETLPIVDKARSIELIAQREQVREDYLSVGQRLKNSDESYTPEIKGEMDLLLSKENALNDKIAEIKTGQKFTYYSQDGTYYKQLPNGQSIEISENDYQYQQQVENPKLSAETAQATIDTPITENLIQDDTQNNASATAINPENNETTTTETGQPATPEQGGTTGTVAPEGSPIEVELDGEKFNINLNEVAVTPRDAKLDDENYSSTFTIDAKGKTLGHLILRGGKEFVTVSMSQLYGENNYRKKIGSEAYKTLGKQIKDQYNKTLRSSNEDSRNSNSNALWESLVKQGFAEKIESGKIKGKPTFYYVYKDNPNIDQPATSEQLEVNTSPAQDPMKFNDPDLGELQVTPNPDGQFTVAFEDGSSEVISREDLNEAYGIDPDAPVADPSAPDSVLDKIFDQTDVQSAIDFINSLKIKNKGTNVTILPAQQLYNAALDIVVAGIKTTNSFKNAVALGVEYLRSRGVSEDEVNGFESDVLSKYKQRPSRRPAEKRADYAKRLAAYYEQKPKPLAGEKKGEYARRLKEWRVAKNLPAGSVLSARPVRSPDETPEQFANRLNDWRKEKLAIEQDLAAGSSRTSAVFGQTWELEDETFGEWLERKQTDFLNPLRKAIAAIKKAGGNITPENDPYLQYHLMTAKAAKEVQNLFEKIYKSGDNSKQSLLERAKADGVEVGPLGLFMQAQHAEERNIQKAKEHQERYNEELDRLLENRANNITNGVNNNAVDARIAKLQAGKLPGFELMPDGGSGMFTEEANDILQAYIDDGTFDAYDKYAKEFREEVFEPELEMKLNNGLMSPIEYQNIKDAYKKYVPLQVEEHVANRFIPSSVVNILNIRNNTPKAKGSINRSFKERINPVLYGMVQMENTIIETAKNAWAGRLAEIVRENPNDEVWKVVKGTYVPKFDKNGKLVEMEDQTPKDIIDQSLRFYEEGKPSYIHIADEKLRKAVKKENVKKAIPVLSDINSYYRTINTLRNPNFIFDNLPRDVQDAFTRVAREDGVSKKEFLKNVPRAIKGLIQYEMGKRGTEMAKWVDDFKNSGGEVSFADYAKDIEQIKRLEKVLNKDIEANSPGNLYKKIDGYLFGFIETSSSVVENATRVSVYKTLVESGYDKSEAAKISREASIDFAKKGEYSAWLNSAYLFYNAAAQGGAATLRLIASPGGRKILGGVFMTSFMLGLYNSLMSDEDDDENNYWSKGYDTKRGNHFMFKNLAGDGFFQFPAGRQIQAIMNLGQEAAGIVLGKRDVAEASKHTAMSMFNTFNPLGGTTEWIQLLSPTALDAPIQYATNKNSFGMPTKPNDIFGKNNPNSEFANKTTSDLAKSLASGLNKATGGTRQEAGYVDISPVTMEWLYGNLTGGLGQFVSKNIIKFTGDVAKGDGEAALKDAPLVSRFYTSVPNSSKGSAYDKLTESATEKFSPKETAEFEKALKRALDNEEIDLADYQKYNNTFRRNQTRIDLSRKYDDPEVVDRMMKYIFQ